MDGNFSHCDFCDGNHECYECPDVVIPEKLVARVLEMSINGTDDPTCR